MTRSHPWAVSVIVWTLCTVLPLACSDGSPAGLEGPGEDPFDPDDPAVGLQVFQDACGTCHVGSDGFDLAFFDYLRGDVVRRARAHVGEEQALAIANYVETLQVERRDPDHRPFQPGEGVLVSDEEFWRSAVGGEGIPDGLTADDLRSADLRALPIPFRLSPWSDEEGESDWMPERPLPLGLLDAEGERVRTAVDTYFASPTTQHLVDAVATFRQVSVQPGQVCEGGVLSLDRPLDCFEARRWFSALTAVHLLREGSGEPDREIVRLWWEVGEAGVNVRFHEGGFGDLDQPAFERNTLHWLFLSFQFQPDISPSEGGYLGQFSDNDFPRFATFTQLRRMVHEGELEAELPWLPFRDALRALIRARHIFQDEVAVWAFSYILDRLENGLVLEGEDLDMARDEWSQVTSWYDFTRSDSDPTVAEAERLWMSVRSRLDAMAGS